ncbi:MAG TPA: hypothetical protein VMQ60_13885 [Acidobacteriaceae bacterium]|jgi:hypothetical protein|nr:hypothetical protein [Acidobacteriaceae bacterium]
MCEGLLSPSLRLERAAQQEGISTLTTSSNNENTNPAIPSAAQLTETRLKRWHQQGEALLTIENLRAWINSAGLVLFVPRPQIASPAPSLVEAVLGAPTPTPAIDQTAEARSLLARLVAEGLAVPLNLLGVGPGTVHAGAPGDTPDFVASTAVFSYIFTLRGDKAWKQPPAASGPFKVSPLALATFEALTRRGPLSAYDLTTEVGKEVTEAAILRALGELWTHLRVLPLAQPDGAATLWELSSARFTKQIKAGANAGQPSALSALISLYLGQAAVASEDEIESFLSPLASRSRIRDVIHALLSARQLDTVAVEGRTMLYVFGSLPAFLAPQSEHAEEGKAQAAAIAGELAVEAGAATDAESAAEAAPRITKFIPRPRKIGTGYLAKAKPSRNGNREFGAKPGPFERGTKPGFGAKSGFKPRDGSRPTPDRERRPFSKRTSGFDKTAGFDKPWEEEKARRLASAARPSQVPEELSPGVNDAEGNLAAAASVDGAPVIQPRKPRVFKPRSEGGKPRGEEGGPRTPRKSFSKPGTFGRKREGSASRSSLRPSTGGDARPPRKDFTQRSDRKADRGERPAFGSPRTPGSYAPRPSRGQEFSGKPRSSKSAGFSKSKEEFSGKPFVNKMFHGKQKEKDDRNSAGESGKRVYRKFDAPRDRPARPSSSDRPARPTGAEGVGRPSGDFAPRKFVGKPFTKSSAKPSGFAKKPFTRSSSKPGEFAGKKPYGKPAAPFTGKPSSTFAKFAGNKKPFGNRPPARKFKPRKDDSAG